MGLINRGNNGKAMTSTRPFPADRSSPHRVPSRDQPSYDERARAAEKAVVWVASTLHRSNESSGSE